MTISAAKQKLATAMLLRSLLVLSALLLLSLPSYAIDKANIQVSGTARLEVMPDYAKIAITIEHSEKTKAQSQQKNDTLFAKLITQLATLDIGKDEIETTSINAYPQYRWNNGKRSKTGETVRYNIQLRINALSQLPLVYEQLSNLNVNNINRAQYFFTNKHALQRQAIEQALNNAKAKADSIAKTVKRPLGQVYQVVSNARFHQPQYRSRAMAMSDANEKSVTAPYLEPKAQAIEASVQVIYLFK